MKAIESIAKTLLILILIGGGTLLMVCATPPFGFEMLVTGLGSLCTGCLLSLN